MKHTRPILALFLFFVLVYLFLDFYYGIFNQPYLWDELGVYSRASIRMYQDGISLMPDAIPDELSRGHPLLCPFYFSIAFKLFGCTPLVGHLAAALLNSLAFIFFYLILSKALESFYAMMATMAVFVQPMFLSQSVFILPETMLMLWTVMSIYFYLEGKYWLMGLGVVLALFTKESATILPIGLILTELFVKGKKIKLSFVLTAFFLPLGILTLFFIVQKVQRGYYFYPLHTGLVKTEWYYILERWKEFKRFAFFEQGHLLALLLMVIALLFIREPLKSLKNNRLVIPIIVMGGICFLCLNFFLSRYTLYFMLPFYLLMVFIINEGAKKRLSVSLYAYLLIGLFGVMYWNGEGKYTDVDFSYVPHLNNLQAALIELDEEEYKDKSIYMGFPLAACYWEKDNGYKRQAHYQIHLDTSQLSEYKVYTLPGNIQDTAFVSKAYARYKHIGDSSAFTLIYKRK